VIFDGETGLLVPDGGADAVARFGHAWKTLVADPELLARLGRDARKRADASTWASSIDTWEEILLEAVASGSG
jgi:glycosyltransferase involved in cell wall biosynthesis